MKYLLSVGAMGQPVKQAVVMPGETTLGNVVSPWLVSAGQNFPIEARLEVIGDEGPEPGSLLINCAECRTNGTSGWVMVPNRFTSDVCHLPSERPLYEILADIVKHGVEHPSHGTDCICMDAFVYEVRRHVSRALPAKTTETYHDSKAWAAHFDAAMRVKHVLRLAVYHL